MKNYTIALMALIMPLSAHAISLVAPVDLGPPGVKTGAFAPVPPLAGIPLAGDTLVLDLQFLPGEFARVFTASLRRPADFTAFLMMVTDVAGLPGFPTGTGYLVDSAQNPIHTPLTLGSAAGSDGKMACALFPLLSGEIGAPTDFHGVHLDLNLPSNPGHQVTDASFTLGGVVFGVGPRVPVDVVPDAGASCWLLALGLGAVVLARKGMVYE